MNVEKRNLILGFAGMLILLISVLIFAQINASQNFDLGEYGRQAD